MFGFGPSGHNKKHRIDSTEDHAPEPGATGGNLVTIDPATKLPKDSGTSLAAITGGIKIVGGWDASTNTPTLTSGSGTAGNGYIVTVAGNTNLDGITDWKVNDIAWFDGVASVWRKIDNTEPAHDELTNLNWSAAGHTMDDDLDMNAHAITQVTQIAGEVSATKPMKVVSPLSDVNLELGDNAGVKKVKILDSDKNIVATIDSNGNIVADGSGLTAIPTHASDHEESGSDQITAENLYTASADEEYKAILTNGDNTLFIGWPIKVYSQAAEPTLDDGQVAIWIDTDDSNRRWLVSRFSSVQKKVELASHSRIHASEHTDGTDDIQDATASQKGLMTQAFASKLDGIEAGADVTADHPPQTHSDTHLLDGTDEINPSDILPSVILGYSNTPWRTPVKTGDTYVVGPSPTGDFAGQAGTIANKQSLGWTFTTPTEVYIFTSVEDGKMYINPDADTTWIALENNFASDFTGAGSNGLVPDPTSETGKYLKDNGTWDTPSGGGAGSDTTAIHDDTAGEIHAISGKTDPEADDEIVAENSASSWAKVKMSLSNLKRYFTKDWKVSTYAYNMYGAPGTFNGVSCSAAGLSSLNNLNGELGGIYRSFDDGQGSGQPEAALMTLKLPPHYKAGDNIKVIVNWCAAATSGNVKYGIGLSAIGAGETFRKNYTYVTGTASPDSSTAYGMVVTEASFTGTGFEPGDVIELIMYRDADDSGDTMSGDALVSLIAIEEDL